MTDNVKDRLKAEAGTLSKEGDVATSGALSMYAEKREQLAKDALSHIESLEQKVEMLEVVLSGMAEMYMVTDKDGAWCNFCYSTMPSEHTANCLHEQAQALLANKGDG